MSVRCVDCNTSLAGRAPGTRRCGKCARRREQDLRKTNDSARWDAWDQLALEWLQQYGAELTYRQFREIASEWKPPPASSTENVQAAIQYALREYGDALRGIDA